MAASVVHYVGQTSCCLGSEPIGPLNTVPNCIPCSLLPDAVNHISSSSLTCQSSVHEQQNHHLSRTEPADQLVSPGELFAFDAKTDREACIPLSFINEGCPDILTWWGDPLLSTASDVEFTVATQGGTGPLGVSEGQGEGVLRKS